MPCFLTFDLAGGEGIEIITPRNSSGCQGCPVCADSVNGDAEIVEDQDADDVEGEEEE